MLFSVHNTAVAVQAAHRTYMRKLYKGYTRVSGYVEAAGREQNRQSSGGCVRSQQPGRTTSENKTKNYLLSRANEQSPLFRPRPARMPNRLKPRYFTGDSAPQNRVFALLLEHTLADDPSRSAPLMVITRQPFSGVIPYQRCLATACLSAGLLLITPNTNP